MTQIDKAIEYLKKAVEDCILVEPEEMLRDIFCIERKIVSEYKWFGEKKEIKVGNTVRVIGPSLGGTIDMLGSTFDVEKITISGMSEKEFHSSTILGFPESSVELI